MQSLSPVRVPARCCASRPASSRMLLALAWLAAACGDNSTGPVPAVVATIAVSPSSATLSAGATSQLVASARNAAGNPVSGVVFAWGSSNPAAAQVDQTGLVRGLAAGTATISASANGVNGTATITVAPAPAVEIVGGDMQRGLVGRPLADSLTLRVRTSAGSPMPGATVAWITSAGSLSSPSTVTDGNGIARVQWLPGPGDVTATATAQALSPVTFRANGRMGGACSLVPSPQNQRFSLGPTDFTLSLDARKPIRIAVLFVDFSDAVATETTGALMSAVVNPGLQLMLEMSYGRANITAVPFPKWYRMPSPITSYTWTTYDGHRTYLLDVLAVSDAEIDFSGFDALFVFAPPHPSKPVSPTFNGGVSANVVADGRNFGNAVTFGLDARTYGPAVLAHETGHMFGLVDLYAYSPAGGAYAGNQFKFVGAWSLMSNIFNPAHYLAWEKRKLGFIDEAQVDCLQDVGGVEAILTPGQATGGRKMVIAPIDASSAVVVEVRSDQGLDANLCSQGVLVYLVDARIASGTGAAVVLGSKMTTSGPAFAKCGPWADATFGSGPGDIASYRHAPSGTAVDVLRAETAGAFRVRVRH